jgi:hypothetical protein
MEYNMKIVINNVLGGFGLSPAAVRRYADLAGFNVIEYGEPDDWTVLLLHATYSGKYEDMTPEERDGLFSPDTIGRTDKYLIQTIEELGTDANGKFARLKIVEIPDDVDWIIQEYDGVECVAERHRTWH